EPVDPLGHGAELDACDRGDRSPAVLEQEVDRLDGRRPRPGRQTRRHRAKRRRAGGDPSAGGGPNDVLDAHATLLAHRRHATPGAILLRDSAGAAPAASRPGHGRLTVTGGGAGSFTGSFTGSFAGGWAAT